MRTRNTLFIVAICLFLIGPFSLCVGQNILQLSLPSWVTAEDAAYLSGGITEVSFDGSMSVKGFAEKQLQDDLEDALGNFIPAKATALLGNAGLQRAAISASASLFGWDCYPTFYGSAHVFLPQQRAVSAIPSLKKSDLSSVKKFCRALKGFANRYPNLQIKVYVVDYSLSSQANPAMKYVSGAVDTGQVADTMKEEVQDCDKVEILADCFSNTDEYYGYFFRSDHHWNARGALLAYESIVEEGSGTNTLQETGFSDVKGPRYSGAYARNSLCIVEDTPFDFSYTFQDSEISRGDAWVSATNHDEYYDASWENEHWRFYDLYYQTCRDGRGPGENGQACLVADSFGGALLRPLTLGYSKIRYLDNMHATVSSKDRLGETVDVEKVDTLILVGHAQNYTTFLRRNTNFFNES